MNCQQSFRHLQNLASRTYDLFNMAEKLSLPAWHWRCTISIYKETFWFAFSKTADSLGIFTKSTRERTAFFVLPEQWRVKNNAIPHLSLWLMIQTWVSANEAKKYCSFIPYYFKIKKTSWVVANEENTSKRETSALRARALLGICVWSTLCMMKFFSSPTRARHWLMVSTS